MVCLRWKTFKGKLKGGPMNVFDPLFGSSRVAREYSVRFFVYSEYILKEETHTTKSDYQVLLKP